jgi:hypothetical protein
MRKYHHTTALDGSESDVNDYKYDKNLFKMKLNF